MDGLMLVLKTLFSWTLRLALLAMGLLVFLSFLVLIAALGLIWGVRALWAKLLGRPVRPWVMKVAPRDAWGRFGARPGGAGGSMGWPLGGPIDASDRVGGAPGVAVPPSRRPKTDVEDVEIKGPK
jgi:hypothetical protein